MERREIQQEDVSKLLEESLLQVGFMIASVEPEFDRSWRSNFCVDWNRYSYLHGSWYKSES